MFRMRIRTSVLVEKSLASHPPHWRILRVEDKEENVYESKSEKYHLVSRYIVTLSDISDREGSNQTVCRIKNRPLAVFSLLYFCYESIKRCWLMLSEFSEDLSVDEYTFLFHSTHKF